MIWLICLIPVCIALFAKFALKFDICWKEFAIQVAIGIIAVSLIWVGGYFSKTGDQEVWNGAVTATNVATERCYKDMFAPKVCRNSYSCNCHQVCSTSYDSKGNATQSCHTECDTCYRYPWEKDYNVESNVGNFTIARIDNQGRNVPPRWAQTRVGDPVSTTHNFQNWVKAASGTLFRDADSIMEKYEGKLPTYPIQIYDYYNIRRTLTVGTRLSNVDKWNSEISKALVTLGPTRQMNLIVVVANNVDPDYAYALRRHWDGFKKNDAVVFIGTRNNTVAWVEVLSWSKDASFEVKSRTYLNTLVGQHITTLDPKVVVPQIGAIAKTSFVRRPMKDFEYLRGDIDPPGWLLWTSIIFSIIMGAGLSAYFHANELFTGNSSRYFR